MIRLTTDDILTVVSLYQQHIYALQSRDYEQVSQHLQAFNFYLPEDP